MLSEPEKAYAAGMIDGDGCIGVYNTRTKKDKRAAYYQLTVRVCKRSPRIPYWFTQHFPGTVHTGKTAKGYPTWTWQVRNVEAEAVLREIVTYLVLKQDQAKTALEFAELRREQFLEHEPWRGKRYGKEILEQRDVYVEKLKLLKKDSYPLSQAL
jgi:hypothetical protein